MPCPDDTATVWSSYSIENELTKSRALKYRPSCSFEESSHRVRTNAVRVLRPLTYAGAGACMRNDIRRRTINECALVVAFDWNAKWHYTFATKVRESYRRCDVLWRAWCMSLELCTSADQGSPGQKMNF